MLAQKTKKGMKWKEDEKRSKRREAREDVPKKLPH